MMHRPFGILLVLTCLFGWQMIYAQNSFGIKASAKPWGFVKNKGQVNTEDEGLNKTQYYAHSGQVSLFCYPGQIRFVFSKEAGGNKNPVSEAEGAAMEDGGWHSRQEHKTEQTYAALVFEHANIQTQITAADSLAYYENYYQGAGRDFTHLTVYKTIIYKGIYPNIDFELQTRPDGAEYSFVVHPGGHVGDIAMHWQGVGSCETQKNGSLVYSMANGSFQETRPCSYQNGGSQPVQSAFEMQDGIVHFVLGSYDHTKDLVIDPTIIWGTYFGGENGDYGYGIATDAEGNVYVTGSTSSLTGIAGPGAFQAAFGGSGDAFITKMNSKGVYLWSTYFGGSSEDAGYCDAVDQAGNLYIAGYTGSHTGIATQGAWQTATGGYYDAFLAKFSADGTRLWSTYLGGSGDDRAYGVTTDPLNNAIITGYTSSDSGIASAGAWQTAYHGVQGDVFVAKYSSSGKQLWSTYYGGPDDDRGNAIASDSAGHIYITGISYSTSGITTARAWQPVFQGNGYDAFVSEFSPAGSLVWGTYFGSGAQAHGIATDHAQNIIITGDTDDSTDISSSGGYQVNYGGGQSDAFVAKFAPGGRRIWSTYLGGEKNDYGYAIATDDSDNIAVAGRTNSLTGIAGPSSYQPRFGGGSSDAFIMRFKANGRKDWSTYFGGTSTDIGYGIATDKWGYVYATGQASSTNGLATDGAYRPIKEGKSDDGFIAKFGYKYRIDAGINQVLSPKIGLCPGTWPITVQLKNFGTGTLDSVTIGWSFNHTNQPAYYWYGTLKPDSVVSVSLGTLNFAAGIDTLKAWTQNPNGMADSFPQNDSVQSIFTIYALPNANAGPDTTLCYDESYIMQGSGGITYTWTPARYLSSASNPNAIAMLHDSAELYTLVVTNANGCTDSAHVLLRVQPRLLVKVLGPQQEACYGQEILLRAEGRGGYAQQYNFSWPNDTAAGDSVYARVYQSGWHHVVLKDHCSPDSATDSIYIKVFPRTIASFTVSPGTVVEYGHPVNFENHSLNAASYIWTFGDGDSSRATDAQHFYADTGHFAIKLIAAGQNNCPGDTAVRYIFAGNGIVPIYVPNVFTPDGDGLNDYFVIGGSYILNYQYAIYNRWGERIFESSTQKPNWDGTFKGNRVPNDVYIYQLDVLDIYGDHHFLRGTVMTMW